MALETLASERARERQRCCEVGSHAGLPPIDGPATAVPRWIGEAGAATGGKRAGSRKIQRSDASCFTRVCQRFITGPFIKGMVEAV